MHHLGLTRSSRKLDHLLQTPNTFIRTPLPGAAGVEFVVHAAPQLGVLRQDDPSHAPVAQFAHQAILGELADRSFGRFR